MSKFKKICKFHFVKCEQKIVSYGTTDKDLSFEWQPYRVSLTDSKLR